ncbi:DNA topoisomerase I, bacterial [Halobacteroides halobius DSM 5150]|uniref:DNA topoisomerase 1 n=1 Tax=Halobacteroides halobius (strain ATCC 35273 / DSM 5150 / MD-1) TaxID=748449 RepID=L0K918_HALHC|nr:type I DNA topoisomerase [Halobacteroides halobius]AGB40618.1 DNA topoisomerase I, bacterial [Halobacteroides halobius DSM 5150]
MAKDKNLVIVESPAKAKTISKFLGSDFTVEASMGHVIDLPKSQLGVDVENNFEPKYITIRGKGKTLQKLKRKAKKSKEVLLATDPDREGEAISWHLARALKMDEESDCRIEFNEITKSAVQDALEEPRRIDQDRVDAQQARRVLDRLVGYKLSPLLWKKVKKGLSAGRVQSVAVRIICEREEEIKAFEPQEYWTLDTKLKDKNKGQFKAKLYRINNKKFALGSKQETDQVISELKEEDLKVSKIKEGKRRRNPSPPFTTSSLQQQASNYLHFSTKKTMYLAQQLYEGIDLGAEGTVGLITYMRTDSTRISKEAQANTRDYIADNLGDKYLPDTPKKYKAKSGAQDAHEAIRPTSVFKTPQKVKQYLGKQQYKLYKLIWERFVASQMKPAVYKTLRVNIKGEKYWLRANGSQQVFPGFLKVDTSKQQKKDKELPSLEEGAKIDIVELLPDQHFTKPPARYSEAKLVKTLEKKGIGRPSTYAAIVGTIEKRGYVTKENKRFKPTELGEIVNGLLVEHFPNVTNVKFTAQLEADLDRIEAGKNDWIEVLKSFYSPFSDRLEEAKENMEQVQLEEKETDVICEKCGNNMVIKHGRYGKFLACPGFPDCKNTKPLLDKVGVKCPECKDGDVVKRKSKKGRTFYGCSNYPDCEFMTWHQPVEKKCPECGKFLVEKRTKKETKRYCINSDCDYEE